MTKKERKTQILDTDNPASPAEQHGAALGREVLRLLGEPGNFHSIQVRPLWDNRYRANVLIGPDAASVSIAHSFFLETDSAGGILLAIPPITRLYGAEETQSG